MQITNYNSVEKRIAPLRIIYFCTMARRKQNRKIFLETPVTDAGAKGKAIAHAPDGRVIFLTNAVPGDVVDIQTTKRRKSYYEGQAIRFHTLSRKRTQPACNHFEVCGGCKWQHMNYEYQLHYKQQEVTNNLERIGHLELPNLLPIVGSKQQYNYRNKMEFSFSANKWLTQEEIDAGTVIKEKRALGFHIAGMWDKILDITQCHLQPEPSNAIRNGIREFAIKNDLSFFDTRKQEGLLRTLMIRTTTTGEVMVLVQFFKEEAHNRKLLLDYIKNTYPEITSLLYVINNKGNDTIYDLSLIHI